MKLCRLAALAFPLSLSPIAAWAQATPAATDLVAGFANPPESAKPHTWWHWMNGNVTKQGITADLEAMKRVGIGGAHIADVGVGIPKGKIAYDSQDRIELVQWAFKESERLGQDLCLFNCPGWSSSGGPWVKPEHSMKVLGVTETAVVGGKKVSFALAQPPAQKDFYRDVCVLAFPTPASDSRILNYDNGLGPNRPAAPPTPRPGTTQPATTPAPVDPDASPIDPAKVIDLSNNIDAQGQLTWDAPAGNWTILRIGFTTNGKQNHPGPEGGTGLEIDKFSREALDAHFDYFFGPYYEVMKPLAAKGKAAGLIDSYEMGPQNWTDQFPDEFKKRRGYDLTTYMPAMAQGRTVGSLAVSQRFLWDVRKTQAELMNEYYYGHFQELCHKHGMQAYSEPYDGGNFDEMAAGAYADLPMAEFWQNEPNHPLLRTMKMVASVTHMNGQPIMGAESFTSLSRWTEYPYALKAQGDFMWTQGLNKFVFHRYAMQPHPDSSVAPAMTMGPFGGHFDRTNTWFEPGRAWMQYIARSQFLLQQGIFVGDLLYFTGENSPVKCPELKELVPPPPAGYDYDTIDPITLKKRVKIVDGKITIPNGPAYRLLALPPNLKTITLETMQNIHDLVNQGMCLVVNGPKPEQTPSLMGYPNADVQIAKLAADLWGNLDGSKQTEHTYGKGRIFWGVPISNLLQQKLGAKPDFFFTARSGNADIHYIHKRAGNADIYFVANHAYKSEDLVCEFNIDRKQPEFWDAATGHIAPAPVYGQLAAGGIRVPLRLDPAGSLFVVFRHPLPPATRKVTIVRRNGAYVVMPEHFQKANAPPAVTPRPSGPQMPMPLPDPEDPPAIELTANGDLLAWQNGEFELALAAGQPATTNVTGIAAPVELTGPWTVKFPPKRGAPAEINLEKLVSWPDHADKGVKFFSGTATYTNRFSITPDQLATDKRLFLDLGRVQVLAEVLVNGKNLGILWKLPFRVDITDAARPGDNDLEIRITNLWPNRLIGDEQAAAPPPATPAAQPATTQPRRGGAVNPLPDWYVKGEPKPDDGRITFTAWRHWQATDPLLESGLIGPVLLRTATRLPVK